MPNAQVRLRLIFGNQAAGYDPDAAAFFAAAGIADPTQKSAVSALATSLKANGLWASFPAIYPLVGGTATTHKFNLVNPADSDAAFRMSFAGTVTHDANGITGNGSDAYADTKFDFSTNGSQNSASMICYCRTQSPTNGGYLMGANNGTGSADSLIVSASFLLGQINDVTSQVVAASSDFRGFVAVTRVDGSNSRARMRSVEAAGAASSVAAAAKDVSLLSRAYQGFPNDNFSNCNLAFAALGSGLTSDQLDTLKTILDTYETALGRNV